MLRLAKKYYLIFPLLALCCAGWGQKLEKVKGEAQIRLDDIGREAALKEVRQQAKLNALENAFGTYVEQETYTEVENGRIYQRIKAENRVKGEWVQTLKESISEDVRKEGGQAQIWVRCKIVGRARKYDKPPIQLEAIPLNRPDKANRTYEFQHKEPFYLYFRSPAAGYLTLYALLDDEKAYRLLPYRNMTGQMASHVPVEADVEYYFFDEESHPRYFPDVSAELVDPMALYTDKQVEFLEIYVVYSPEPFVKPSLDNWSQDNEDYITPKSLDQGAFEGWLSQNKAHSSGFRVKKINLSITRK